MAYQYSPSERETIGKASAQLTDLLTAGKATPGMNLNCRPNRVPEWFEADTFAHAQHLFQVYGFIMALTRYFGLMFGLNQTEGLLPLLTTGNSKSINSLFLRYISTERHVLLWFSSDPFDPNSDAYKSLKTVRGLHSQVYDKLNSAAEIVPNGTTKLWMSQFAMAGAQFSFFGLMTLFPKQLGYQNFTAKDYHAIFHFWRTIGYCMGMEDRYNLCSGSDAQIKELCSQIFYCGIEPLMLKKSEPTGVEMCKGVCLAFSSCLPLLSYNVIMHFLAPLHHADPSAYPLTLLEQFYLHCLRFLLGTLSRYPSITRLLTRFFTIFSNRNLHYLEYYKQLFEEKYSDITFSADKRCPFTIKLNYTANLHVN